MFFNAGDIALAIGSGRASYKMSRGTFSTHGHIYKKLPLALGNESEGSCTYYSKKTGEEAAVTVKISESGGVTKLAFCVPEGFNRMWITLPAVKDEHIYGCGEQFGVLDLKGKKAVIWVSEHHSVKKFIKNSCARSFSASITITARTIRRTRPITLSRPSCHRAAYLCTPTPIATAPSISARTARRYISAAFPARSS